jgi:hypothetical protein
MVCISFAASSPTERAHGVSRPSLCVIAQGAKKIYLCDDCFRCNPARTNLLAVVSLPVVIQIAEGSRLRCDDHRTEYPSHDHRG